jgi:hypothetical protein
MTTGDYDYHRRMFERHRAEEAAEPDAGQRLSLAGQAELAIGRHHMQRFGAALGELESAPGVAAGELPAIAEGILRLSAHTGAHAEDIASPAHVWDRR